MGLEVIIVLIILGIAIVLFATELLPVDLSAILIMITLMVLGILKPEEAVEGFSNPAIITIGAMFVLSAGVFKTGAVNIFETYLSRAGRKSYILALIILMTGSAFFSAFVNNTAVVAIFLPVVISAAREMKVNASKLLIPLSFASLFGGVCTLIGTSTNLLVSSLSGEYTGQPFTMFEFTKLGLVFLIAGILYMLLIGFRTLPNRQLVPDFSNTVGDYITEVIIPADSEISGMKLKDSFLIKNLNLNILQVIRNKKRIMFPGSEFVIYKNDTLIIKGELNKIQILQNKKDIQLKARKEKEEEEERSPYLVELILMPNSFMGGRTLKNINFEQRFNGTVLALRHRGELLYEQLSETLLKAGDVLLVQTEKEKMNEFRHNNDFLVLSEPGSTFHPKRIMLAVAIISFVVIFAATGILPIMVTAITGAFLMIVTRCISLKDAYESIEWKIIFLLAGVLTLGMAMEKTGAADLIATVFINNLSFMGPVMMLSAFYLLTSVFTEVISNNAAAVLLVPIGIHIAAEMGVDARPFLFAVAFAASASFMTPIGYQTNTLVYGAGNYRFKDFLKTGTPLNILFWILASFLLPLFWPL